MKSHRPAAFLPAATTLLLPVLPGPHLRVPATHEARPMKAIVDIEIAPLDTAAVTPCELLEDFADATPAWHFLEEDTRHYAAVKGVPGCVLRHFHEAPALVVDFAFAAEAAHAGSVVHLLVIDVDDPQEPLSPERRRRLVATLLTDLQHYMDRRGMPARVHAVEAELDSVSG